MVAHNIADVPQEDPSIVFLTVSLFIAPPNKVVVGAALIGRANAKSFMENGECTGKTNFPVPI